jgi:hypothetical protein
MLLATCDCAYHHQVDSGSPRSCSRHVFKTCLSVGHWLEATQGAMHKLSTTTHWAQAVLPDDQQAYSSTHMTEISRPAGCSNSSSAKGLVIKSASTPKDAGDKRHTPITPSHPSSAAPFLESSPCCFISTRSCGSHHRWGSRLCRR